MLRRDRAIAGSNAELKREGVRRELVQNESLRATGAPGEIRTPDVLLAEHQSCKTRVTVELLTRLTAC
jgi:hypothetical protein